MLRLAFDAASAMCWYGLGTPGGQIWMVCMERPQSGAGGAFESMGRTSCNTSVARRHITHVSSGLLLRTFRLRHTRGQRSHGPCLASDPIVGSRSSAARCLHRSVARPSAPLSPVVCAYIICGTAPLPRISPSLFIYICLFFSLSLPLSFFLIYSPLCSFLSFFVLSLSAASDHGWRHGPHMSPIACARHGITAAGAEHDCRVAGYTATPRSHALVLANTCSDHPQATTPRLREVMRSCPRSAFEVAPPLGEETDDEVACTHTSDQKGQRTETIILWTHPRLRSHPGRKTDARSSSDARTDVGENAGSSELDGGSVSRLVAGVAGATRR